MKTKYFENEKMRKCPCGCGFDMTDKALWCFDKARAIAGIPFVLTSGARCPQYNKNIGSVENSAHIQGLAMDISFKNKLDMLKIINGLAKAGFSRIGLNMSEKFIHADIDDSLPTPAYWTYK
jgi:uncharacterized protein YcbK (DUF882 family)